MIHFLIFFYLEFMLIVELVLFIDLFPNLRMKLLRFHTLRHLLPLHRILLNINILIQIPHRLQHLFLMLQLRHQHLTLIFLLHLSIPRSRPSPIILRILIHLLNPLLILLLKILLLIPQELQPLRLRLLLLLPPHLLLLFIFHLQLPALQISR